MLIRDQIADKSAGVQADQHLHSFSHKNRDKLLTDLKFNTRVFMSVCLVS